MRSCKEMLESYGWNLLGVEKSNPASLAQKLRTCWKGLAPIRMQSFTELFTRTDVILKPPS